MGAGLGLLAGFKITDYVYLLKTDEAVSFFSNGERVILIEKENSYGCSLFSNDWCRFGR